MRYWIPQVLIKQIGMSGKRSHEVPYNAVRDEFKPEKRHKHRPKCFSRRYTGKEPTCPGNGLGESPKRTVKKPNAGEHTNIFSASYCTDWYVMKVLRNFNDWEVQNSCKHIPFCKPIPPFNIKPSPNLIKTVFLFVSKPTKTRFTSYIRLLGVYSFFTRSISLTYQIVYVAVH